MKKASIWSMKLNAATLVLIPAAVAINYIGKLFAAALKLPLWLDSIGTMLAASLAGPVAGAVCGAINNIIYGFQDPISFVYAITSIGIGIAAGLLARCGFFDKMVSALAAGVIIAAVAVAISTPLNLVFWGGQTGNMLGDAAFAACLGFGLPAWLASLIDEVVVDLPDKIVTVLIVFLIFRGLPKKLKILFKSGEQVERID